MIDPKSTVKVAIITVTYNADSFIEDYLASVAEILRVKPDFRLILVDNASTDTTVQTIRDFIATHSLSNQVELLSQQENSGFGQGCNAGAAAAAKLGADYYWFLNPDTTADLEAAEALLACMHADPEIDFVGSALKNEHGVKRSGAFRFPGLLTTFISNAGLGFLDRLMPDFTSTFSLSSLSHTSEPISVHWLTGASFIAKAPVFKVLHGFDENYFLYFEEIDLFLRAKRAGYKACFSPKSVVYHQSGASTGINTKGPTKRNPLPPYWFESRRYFYNKNFGYTYFLLVNLAFLTGQAISRLKALITRREVNDPPGLVWGIVRSTVGARSARRANQHVS